MRRSPKRRGGPGPRGGMPVEGGLRRRQGGRTRREAGEDRGRRSGPGGEKETRRQAGKPEQDPEPSCGIGAKGAEGPRQQGDPRRREERKDALDAKGHQDPASSHLALNSRLGVEVVKVTGVRDDQTRPGGERRPVGIDDVVVGKQRKDDKRHGDGEQRDGTAPSPPTHSSSDSPSLAARTSIPMRRERSVAIFDGFARQTVVP